jgi:hypothetical protein
MLWSMKISRKAMARGAVLAAALAAFAAYAGRMLVVDDPQPSDVILVLAGETEHRPARALQLLDQGYGRRVVIDVPADASIFGVSELQIAEKYAAGLPEAAAVRICPIVGLSTREESHDVERCLAKEAGGRILIVTSEFHTRRALSIFRHELPGKTFSVAVARDGAEFGTRWWMHREWAKTCVGEWERLLWWSAVERWQ